MTPSGRVLIAAYSHELRADTLDGTLEAMHAVGATVDHVTVQTTPPSSRGNRANATATLAAMVHHPLRGDTAGVLLIEDDIRPAQTLTAWLDLIAAECRHPTTLYTPNGVTRYAPEAWRAVMSGERTVTTGALHACHALRGWWGSQAVYFPWQWAEYLIRHPLMTQDDHGGPFDTTLREILLLMIEPLVFTLPSIVQHTAPRNLVAPHRKAHHSISYHEHVMPPAPRAR